MKSTQKRMQWLAKCKQVSQNKRPLTDYTDASDHRRHPRHCPLPATDPGADAGVARSRCPRCQSWRRPRCAGRTGARRRDQRRCRRHRRLGVARVSVGGSRASTFEHTRHHIGRTGNENDVSGWLSTYAQKTVFTKYSMITRTREK